MPTASSPTPQPNVTALKFSLGFWLVIVLTGAGSGLAGALLMKLLRFTQHLCYSYNSGDFLEAATITSRQFRSSSIYSIQIAPGTKL